MAAPWAGNGGADQEKAEGHSMGGHMQGHGEEGRGERGASLPPSLLPSFLPPSLLSSHPPSLPLSFPMEEQAAGELWPEAAWGGSLEASPWQSLGVGTCWGAGRVSAKPRIASIRNRQSSG